MNLAAPGLRGMRVLWVDDQPENNWALRRLPTGYGSTIEIAKSTAEATDKALRGDFDVVISDYGRGETSETGAMFAEWIERTQYDVPVLFYSYLAASIPNDVRAALTTDDPAGLLRHIAEIGLDRMAGNRPSIDGSARKTSAARASGSPSPPCRVPNAPPGHLRVPCSP